MTNAGRSSARQDSKRAARERAAAERARQQAADLRRRRITNLVVGLVVIAVVVGIGGYVVRQVTNDGPQGAVLPSLVNEPGGGVVLGDGPVAVALWEDFQCPGCQGFESAYGEMLSDRVEQGDVTMTVHPLSFLDRRLDNDSSVLAANAFGCASDAGQQQALDFHLLVYANQPEELPGRAAWSVDQLIDWGNDVGIEGQEWEGCVTDLAYEGWVSQVQATMSEAGITSTPTVFVDGQAFDLASGDLEDAIDAALADRG